ncbi:MAG: response regulator [Proteobacteria bacterium]|nr:response regulator [Pseudomonadota bacterium]
MNKSGRIRPDERVAKNSMTKSILVLEQNPEIQGLIASSLNPESIEIHQESDPEAFLSKAYEIRPDLIFVGNTEQALSYETCRGIRAEHAFDKVPLVLLDKGSEVDDNNETLAELGIDDRILKPFDALKLKHQLRKHLSLKQPFLENVEGSGNLEQTELVDSELSELMDDIQNSEQQPGSEHEEPAYGLTNRNIEEIAMSAANTDTTGSSQNMEIKDASEMDSLMLDDDLGDLSISLEPLTEEELQMDQQTPSVQEKQTPTDLSPESSGSGMLEDDLAGDHLSDREEEEFAVELAEAVAGGLNDFAGDAPSFEVDLEPAPVAYDGEDPPQTLREGQTPIDLKINDFEDPEELWKNPPDLNQIPRDNLAEIKMEVNDFEPELPKNLKPLGEPIQQTSPRKTAAAGESSGMKDMDDFVIESTIEDEYHPVPNELDQIVLAEQGVQQFGMNGDSEDLDEFMLETSEETLETISETEEELVALDEEDQSGSGDSALDELDALNQEMAALEAAEEVLAGDAAEEEAIESWEEAEDELREFVLDELDGYLEDEEVEEELEREIAAEAEEELALEAEGFGTDELTAVPALTEEETFGDWESAEDAFMNFDRYSDEEEDSGPAVPESATQQEEMLVEPMEVSEMTEPGFDMLEEEEDMFSLETEEEPLGEAIPEPAEEPASLELDSGKLEELVAKSVQKGLESIMPMLVKQVVKEMQEARGR